VDLFHFKNVATAVVCIN